MVETSFVLSVVIGALVLGLAIYFFIITSTQIPFPFGVPDDDAVNSMKALAFAISCSASKHDTVKISWSGPFGAQGSMNCPKQACLVGPTQGGCTIQGGDVRRPFGNSRVNCGYAGDSLNCTVGNFLLRQDITKLNIQDPFSYLSGSINPATWLAAVGVPRYMAYYEAFPQEEYAPITERSDDMLIASMVTGGGLNAIGNLIPVFKVGKDTIKNAVSGVTAGITKKFVNAVAALAGKEAVEEAVDEAVERATIEAAKEYGEKLVTPVATNLVSEGFTGTAAQKLAREMIDEAAQRETANLGSTMSDVEIDGIARTVLKKIENNPYGMYDDVIQGFGSATETERIGIMKNLVKSSSTELSSGLDNVIKTIGKEEFGNMLEAYQSRQVIESAFLQNADGSITTTTDGKAVDLDTVRWGVTGDATREAMLTNAKANFPKIYKYTLSFQSLPDSTLKTTILDKAKAIANQMIDPNNILHSKPVQYMLLEISSGALSDTDILGVPASSVPDYMKCKVLLGNIKGKPLLTDGICALLIANGIGLQKAANINIPAKSVGLNALGLKAAFGGVYTFQLDDDANSFYVPLMKVKDVRWGGEFPVRFNFVSPCSADVVTTREAEPLKCFMPSKGAILTKSPYKELYAENYAGDSQFVMTQVDRSKYNSTGYHMTPTDAGVKECRPSPVGDVTKITEFITAGFTSGYTSICNACKSVDIIKSIPVIGTPCVLTNFISREDCGDIPEERDYQSIGLRYNYKGGFCNTEISGWFAGETAAVYIGTSAIDIGVSAAATVFLSPAGGIAAKTISGFVTGAALAYLQETVLALEWPEQRGGTYTPVTS